MGVFIDMTGKKSGRLSVLRQSGRDSLGNVLWVCQCECGNIHTTNGINLRQGRALSCGCLQRESAKKLTITQPEPIEDRFNRYVMIGEGEDCWEWTGSKNKQGYGTIRYNGKGSFAHRMSYEIYKGDIPDGMHVMHKCDNPSCVNPNHLTVGTHIDNMGDMAKKDRSPKMRGELNGNHKLTKEQVIDIRKFQGKCTAQSAADMFNVSKKTILNIWHRRQWASI